MSILLQRAKSIGEQGEVPVAAVILNQRGHSIGRGTNRRHNSNDPLAHAELIALKQAALIRGDWRFNDCTLIVTLEPCPMCAGALIQARLGKVIFAASDYKRGALGGSLDLANHQSAHHKMKIIHGVKGKEASKVLEEWFKQRRLRYF